MSTQLPNAIADQTIRFSFLNVNASYIELAMQELPEGFQGWSIEPHIEPLKVNNCILLIVTSNYHIIGIITIGHTL